MESRPPTQAAEQETTPRVKRKRVKRVRKRRSTVKRLKARRPKIDADDAVRYLGYLIEAVFVAMILATPLPLGSVAPWARGALFVGAALVLFLWVLRSCLLGRLRIVRNRFWPFVAGYLLLLAFQTIPIPEGLLSLLSPHTADLYARLVPGYPADTGPMPLSLNANATRQEFFRILTLAVFLFVFMNHFRTRTRIKRILWALVALGLFESFYGLAERFSGSPHIFWIPLHDKICVHGTYYNRNHFAGLMEMLTPMVFGFFMALLAGRSRSWRPSRLPFHQRLEQALSKGTTYRNVLLGMVIASMFLAGVLSLSRGGTLGLLVGLLVLFYFTQRGGSGRRGTRVFLFVVIMSLGLLFYRGMGGIIDRFEQLTEEGSSWEGRGDLLRAGLRMAADFPVAGVGGGAFRYVFPAYQPERFGDKVARYLHNDWVQVACETGLLGWVLACAGLAFFLVPLFGALRKRSDTFCRFLFAGAFAGVAAMLLHSLVDFNLYMVPANGLVFVILLGICHAAPYIKGRARGSSEAFAWKEIELSSKGSRIWVPVVALLACAALSVPPVRRGLADLAYNRYHAWSEGKPELYFFWRPGRVTRDEAHVALDRALRLDAGSPEYNFAKAHLLLRGTQEKIVAAARARARALLSGKAPPGADLERSGPLGVGEGGKGPAEDSEDLLALVSTLTPAVKRAMEEEIRADLHRADTFFLAAIHAAPTLPWLHLVRAMAYIDLLPPGRALETERTRLDKWVGNAVTLAPNRPSTLFKAARFYGREILHDRGGIDFASEEGARILDMFRRAVASAPGRYGPPTFAFLLEEARADPNLLFEVTPRTYPARRMLLGFLKARRRWPEALRSVEEMLALCGLDPRGTSLPELEAGTVEFKRIRAAVLWQLRLLQRTGRAAAWKAAASRYNAIQGLRCRKLLDRVSELEGKGRYTEAMKYCGDCLALDWYNLDAYLKLTEIRLRPGMYRVRLHTEEIFRELLRLLAARNAWTLPRCTLLDRVLAGLEPGETVVGRARAGLVTGLGHLRCGDPAAGARLLCELLPTDVPPLRAWNQAHLVHYYLGRALERTGETTQALVSYEKALELAPTHRASLARLAALERPATARGRDTDNAAGPPPTGTSAPSRLEPPIPPGEPAGAQPALITGASGGAPHPVVPRAERIRGDRPAAAQEKPARAAGDAPPPQPPAPADHETGPSLQAEGPGSPRPTAAERLQGLTPRVAWGIDFSGKVTLLGITLENPSAEAAGPGSQGESTRTSPTAGPAKRGRVEIPGTAPSGRPQGATALAAPHGRGAAAAGSFRAGAAITEPTHVVVRCFWEVTEELDPTDYEVLYRYYDSKGSFVHRERRPLLGRATVDGARGKEPPGGIGTVLVHRNDLFLYSGAPREVRIMVRRRRHGKRPPEPLRSITGDRWVPLALPE